MLEFIFYLVLFWVVTVFMVFRIVFSLFRNRMGLVGFSVAFSLYTMGIFVGRFRFMMVWSDIFGTEE